MQLRIVVIKTSFVKVLNFDKAVAFIFIFSKNKAFIEYLKLHLKINKV